MPEAALDFAYTEDADPVAAARIRADLSAIAHAVSAHDAKLDALILTGGFSRGEGSARLGRPLNDYDLIAIRRAPGGDARYAALGHELTRSLGLEVDLMPVWRRRLPMLGRKLFWLDAKLGARVIWGDAGALAAIPSFDASALSRREGPRLLGNRAAGLLLALPGPGQPVDLGQVDLQATKAVLAAMDATLLSAGAYAPRLRERLALTREHPDHKVFAEAVEWKLRGATRPLGGAWWSEAARVLLAAVDATDARACGDGLAERVVHAERTRELRWQPSRNVRRAAWSLVAAARFPDGPPPGEARRILRPLGRVQGRDWPALKQEFFALRARTLQ